MIGALIDALLGPLGALLGGIVTIAGVWLAGKRQGGSEALRKRDAEDMANAYEREKTRAEIERDATGGDARDKLRDDWQRRD